MKELLQESLSLFKEKLLRDTLYKGEITGKAVYVKEKRRDISLI